MSATTSRRPTGLTVLAILAFLGFLTSLVGGLAVLGIGGLAVVVDLDVIGAGVATIIGLALLAVAVIELLVAVGYWRMRPWAWSLGIAVQLVSITISVVELGEQAIGPPDFIVACIVPVAILLYLQRPGIRSALGH